MSRRRVSIGTDSDSRDTGLINPHMVIVPIQNARTYAPMANTKSAGFPRYFDPLPIFRSLRWSLYYDDAYNTPNEKKLLFTVQ